jgi:hydrogenase expression/formation protein HypC
MCLGVPGKVLEVRKDGGGIVTGRVGIGGVIREVNLSFTPEATVGDWVIVHVGIAISVLDEREARRTLRDLEELARLEGAGPANGSAP